LDDQAYYLAVAASPEVGHRFLLAAHQTFSLLAAHQKWDGILILNIPALLSCVLSGFPALNA
jgi:hypothetical protein